MTKKYRNHKNKTKDKRITEKSHNRITKNIKKQHENVKNSKE